MSPLWRDEIRILLTPHLVGLRRLRRGLRPQVVAAMQAPVDAGGGLHWAAALDVLAALLGGARQRGAHAHITLSSHFVRHALVPPSDLLVTQEDELRFARHNFVRVHGPAAETWSLRITQAAGGTLATAVDQELVDALRATLVEHGLAARVLQPALMAAFNPVRAQLPAAGCRLAVVEPGIAVTALLQPDWQRVRSQRLGRSLGADLGNLIARERSLDDETAAEVPTCVLPLLPLEAEDRPAQARVFDPLWPAAEPAADRARGEPGEEQAA